jgi:hypothetical protein
LSAVKDAITAIREAMKLSDGVKRVGDSLKDISVELRDHEKRIIRLEAKWETAIEIAGINCGNQLKQIK